MQEKRRRNSILITSKASRNYLTFNTRKMHPNYWLFTILAENRQEFIAHCLTNGIQATPVSKRNDEITVLKNYTKAYVLPNVDFFAERMVSIPNGQWLTEEDLDFIASTIRAGW